MNRQEAENQLSEAREYLEEMEGVTLFTAANQPYEGFLFEDQTLKSFAEKGVENGVEDVYIFEDRDEEGNLELAGMSFFYKDRAHTMYKQPEEAIRSGEEQEELSDQQRVGYGLDESEEEKQRKREIADELLEEYEEYLQEDEIYDIENRLERMRLRRIIQMKQRVEEEASVDPEEEKRLAKVVYNSDRFNQRFNETDTEMLLDDLDVEYDSNNIRISEVHKRAKSLLKIEK